MPIERAQTPGPPPSSIDFTPNEAKLFAYTLLFNAGELKADWDQVAGVMGLEDGNIAFVRYGQIREKYSTVLEFKVWGKGRIETEGNENENEKNTADHGSEVLAAKRAKRLRTPTKRKATDEDESEEDGKLPKKRQRKDKVPKVNLINDSEVNKQASFHGEADEHDETAQNVKEKFEDSEP